MTTDNVVSISSRSRKAAAPNDDEPNFAGPTPDAAVDGNRMAQYLVHDLLNSDQLGAAADIISGVALETQSEYCNAYLRSMLQALNEISCLRMNAALYRKHEAAMAKAELQKIRRKRTGRRARR